MSRTRILALALTAAVAIGVISPKVIAYATYGKWGTLSVDVYINPANADVTQAAATAALQAGMDVWNTQSGTAFRFNYAGKVNDTTTGWDNRNVILFRNVNNGSTIASTYSWSSNGVLVDTDIVFWDGGFTFFAGSSGCSGGAYIEDIAAHELGHALGLQHSTVPGATMTPGYSTCSQTQRTLEADDIAAVQSLYSGGVGIVDTAPLTISSPTSGTAITQGTSVTLSGPDTQDGTLSPIYGYAIVNTYPHDPAAFTEGLVLTSNGLYESTGLNGYSTLRQVNRTTGAVLRYVTVPPQYFGEGMTIFQNKIYFVTYQSQTGFIYDPSTFNQTGQFFYTGEGWGLTNDSQYLIMSDGTNRIRFLDPTSFQTVRSITVFDDTGAPLTNINELEYINGEIYANIFLTNWVVRINPTTGQVVGRINFAGLLPAGISADVLNGIAYDQATGHLLVTGKYWPSLFEVRLVTGPSADGTTVPGATQIIDSSGAIWTMGSIGAILRNGASAGIGYGSQMLWTNSRIYVLGAADSRWYEWTGSGWINVGTPVPGGTTQPPTSGGGTSADGTTIPSATQIIDSSGAIWTMGANGAILRNGASVGIGYGSQILWKNSKIYVLGTADGRWYEWTGSGWINVGTSVPGGTTQPPTSGGGTSADGTTVPGATQIIDSSGAIWTMGSNGAILRNGASAGIGYGSQMLWKNSKIYVLGAADSRWYEWTGSGWINVGTSVPGGTTQPPISGGGTSADGTTVPGATQIIDSSGAIWTMGSNGAILRNGASAGIGYGSQMLWKNSKIYVLGVADSRWYEWTGSGWLNVGATVP